MKILYCYRYGILGGVCTQLWNRISHLSKTSNIEAHLLVSKDTGIRNYFAGVATLHVGKEIAGLKAWIEQEQFDLVVIIDTPEYFEALCTGTRNYKVLAEVHTSIEKNLQYLSGRSWEPDAFAVPSQYMRSVLKKSFSIPDRKINIIDNCIVGELFEPQDIETPPARPILLWVGKIDDHKSWKDFIAAAEILKRQGLDFEAWLVGGQTCPDGLSAEVIALAEEADILPKFRWFDRIENASMPQLYSAVAQSGGCKLVTSKCESFGMSLLEAFLCGCPVVSSEVGALPEIANDERFVRFYPHGNIEAACKQISKLLEPSNSRLAADVLKEKRPSLSERFSPETSAKALQDTIAKLSATARR